SMVSAPMCAAVSSRRPRVSENAGGRIFLLKDMEPAAGRPVDSPRCTGSPRHTGMVEFLIDQARSFVSAIRFADALDMAVIAGLVYWLLMSVRRRTASAGVIITLLVLA